MSTADKVTQQAELSAAMPLAVKVERAAELMGVSRAHVFRLIAAGQLRTVKSGSRRLVPLTAISEYLARLCT